MGLESTAVRVGGFRNAPGNPNVGEGKDVTYGDRVFKGKVEIEGGEVSVDVADSGGTGFKVLRIPN